MLCSCLSSTHYTTVIIFQFIIKTHFCQHLNSKAIVIDMDVFILSPNSSSLADLEGLLTDHRLFIFIRHLDQGL